MSIYFIVNNSINTYISRYQNKYKYGLKVVTTSIDYKYQQVSNPIQIRPKGIEYRYRLHVEKETSKHRQRSRQIEIIRHKGDTISEINYIKNSERVV